MRDINDQDSVIRLLDEPMYNRLLRTGAFADGILPKLENAFAAINAGVREVLIGDATHLTKNTGQETEGTLITKLILPPTQ